MELNRNERLTIDTSASVVSIEKFNGNARRSSITLINTSTTGQVITIAVGETAADGHGIVLNPGGVWQDSRDGGYWPTQSQITAVSDAAGGALSIQERLVN